VGRDVPVGGLSFLHHRGDLRHRVLGGVDSVGGRGHAAGGHDLDVVGALAQFRARRDPDRVHPVGDHPDAATGSGRRRLVLAGQAHVAVPPGLAQGVPADEQPWSRQQTLAVGARVPVIGAGHVADAGEAPAQHAAHDPGGVRMDVGSG
jgi:hypothetical protein